MSTRRDMRHIGSQIRVGNYAFNFVKQFEYFGSVFTNKNNVNLEIKFRITSASKRYYGSKDNWVAETFLVQRQWCHTSRLLPVLFYDAKACMQLRLNAATLGVQEREILRMIISLEYLTMISPSKRTKACMNSSMKWTQFRALTFKNCTGLVICSDGSGSCSETSFWCVNWRTLAALMTMSTLEGPISRNNLVVRYCQLKEAYAE